MIDNEIGQQLKKIELLLEIPISNEMKKDYYSTSEVAKILGRSDWTVREWCRLGRVWAAKRLAGRGVAKNG